MGEESNQSDIRFKELLKLWPSKEALEKHLSLSLKISANALRIGRHRRDHRIDEARSC